MLTPFAWVRLQSQLTWRTAITWVLVARAKVAAAIAMADRTEAVLLMGGTAMAAHVCLKAAGATRALHRAAAH